ncbi:MAG: hypothetical protein JWR81_1058, partial [Pseudonocardia sp.]|nr:hypothetical protein [Pseudonocardia sp.]
PSSEAVGGDDAPAGGGAVDGA